MSSPLYRYEKDGKKWIGRAHSLSSLEYFDDEASAIKEADRVAATLHYHSYVIHYEDIYVVCSYSELWIWFDGLFDLVVYKKEVV